MGYEILLQVLPEATHVLGDQFQQWCAVLLIVVWCVPGQLANGEAGPGKRLTGATEAQKERAGTPPPRRHLEQVRFFPSGT